MGGESHLPVLLPSPTFRARTEQGQPDSLALAHPAINRIRITMKEEANWTLAGFVSMFLFPGTMTQCVAAAQTPQDLATPSSASLVSTEECMVHAHTSPPPPMLFSRMISAFLLRAGLSLGLRLLITMKFEEMVLYSF